MGMAFFPPLDAQLFPRAGMGGGGGGGPVQLVCFFPQKKTGKFLGGPEGPMGGPGGGPPPKHQREGSQLSRATLVLPPTKVPPPRISGFPRPPKTGAFSPPKRTLQKSVRTGNSRGEKWTFLPTKNPRFHLKKKKGGTKKKKKKNPHQKKKKKKKGGGFFFFFSPGCDFVFCFCVRGGGGAGGGLGFKNSFQAVSHWGGGEGLISGLFFRRSFKGPKLAVGFSGFLPPFGGGHVIQVGTLWGIAARRRTQGAGVRGAVQGKKKKKKQPGGLRVPFSGEFALRLTGGFFPLSQRGGGKKKKKKKKKSLFLLKIFRGT